MLSYLRFYGEDRGRKKGMAVYIKREEGFEKGRRDEMVKCAETGD